MHIFRSIYFVKTLVFYTILFTKQYIISHSTDRTGPLDSVEMFDVTSQQWQKCKQLTVARKHPAVVALNGIIYCIGGIDEDCIDISSMEKYDPSLEYWVKGPSLTKCKGKKTVYIYVYIVYNIAYIHYVM